MHNETNNVYRMVNHIVWISLVHIRSTTLNLKSSPSSFVLCSIASSACHGYHNMAESSQYNAIENKE